MFLTFPENGEEEDYKGSFSSIVLVTKDFTEVGNNKLKLVANERHHMEMLVISVESV